MMINWEHAPKWAMAIAMDVDSTWHYFDKKPYPNRRTGRWDCQGEFRKQAYIDAKQIKLGLQWEQTLQCRPDPANASALTHLHKLYSARG